MIVVDASVVVAALAGDEVTAGRARERLAGEVLAAPALVDLEVLSVLRRAVRSGALPEADARGALADLAALPIERTLHHQLIDRCWELRDNLTGYDAAYVALAEALDAVLVTGDAGIARAPGPRCTIELLR